MGPAHSAAAGVTGTRSRSSRISALSAAGSASTAALGFSVTKTWGATWSTTVSAVPYRSTAAA